MIKYLEKQLEEQFVYFLFVVSFWLSYPLWVNLPTPLEIPFHLSMFTYAIYGGLIMMFDKLNAPNEYKLRRKDGGKEYNQKPYREILPVIALNHLIHGLFYIFLWIPYVGLGLAVTKYRTNPIMIFFR